MNRRIVKNAPVTILLAADTMHVVQQRRMCSNWSFFSLFVPLSCSCWTVAKMTGKGFLQVC